MLSCLSELRQQNLFDSTSVLCGVQKILLPVFITSMCMKVVKWGFILTFELPDMKDGALQFQVGISSSVT